MDFESLKNYYLPILEKNLDKRLTYHGVHHTLDVIDAAVRIAENENINEHGIELLKAASLFHDSGFLKVYKGHEEVSCLNAKEILPRYGYSEEDINQVCRMIMATQIPQSPKDKLSEIICDADLDYLGRDDFKPIADSLFREMVAYHFIETEQQWNRIQLNFLSNHSYFTNYCIQNREEKKQKHLKEIRDIVAMYTD